MPSVPVWFENLHVGEILVSRDGSLPFRYTDKWLASRGAFPLSLTIPLKQDKVPAQIILPWLENLLREGEALA